MIRRNKVQAKALAFLENIKDHKGDACIEWPFHRFVNGYPKLNFEGQSLVASRILCEKVHGPPPSPEYEAAHSCGNGCSGCINPNHVRWLSAQENQRERVAHGTANRGERHGMSKLTSENVLDIWALLQRGEAHALIAGRYGVAKRTVSDIATGNTWAWLTRMAA